LVIVAAARRKAKAMITNRAILNESITEYEIFERSVYDLLMKTQPFIDGHFRFLFR
jgi:hypothetical protein